MARAYSQALRVRAVGGDRWKVRPAGGGAVGGRRVDHDRLGATGAAER